MTIFNKGTELSFNLVFFLLLIAISPNAVGYELATHARITQQAYFRSILAQDDGVLQDFGLDTNIDFGKNYFDVSGDTISVRGASAFATDQNRMPVLDANDKNENFRKSLTIQGWLMRGAIREDDVKIGGENPKYDPYGNIMRVFNHFYDPVNNVPLNGIDLDLFINTICGGLTACVGTYVHAAPDWALGTTDFITSSNTPELTRRNHFTVKDAREAEYRALTGYTKDGTKDIAPSGLSATEPQLRNAYWATLFRSLGDIAHLVEDMGQPQHTRNDAHAGDRYNGDRTVFGHKRFEEDCYA